MAAPGYRLEMTTNKRRTCFGPAPCKGTRIEKDQPVFGTWVPFKETGSFKWRHFGCLTAKVLSNVKKEFEDPAEVDGYDEIPEFYQEKFARYHQDGAVPEEDIPESAKKKDEDEDGEGEGSEAESAGKKGAKKKSGGKKGKAAATTDEEDVKPKKKAPKRKAKKEESDLSELSEEDVKPKKTTARSKAKQDKNEYLADKYMSGAKADAILERSDGTTKKKRKTDKTSKKGKDAGSGLAVVDGDADENLVWEASDAEDGDAPSK